MKKSFYLLAFIGCIMFAGCKKEEEEPIITEDLSYVIRTYYRYESNGHIYKTTWTYDGHQETSNKYYENGLLTSEYKNYSYNGLNASYDYYSYNDSIIRHQHVECEYLDDTYRRVKYRKTQYYDPEPYIYETYYEYDGKKLLGYTS